MVAGRPRTTSYAPNEMVELGKEMIAWFQDHPDALHVSDFYSGEKGIHTKDWDSMVKAKEFSGYYEIALKLVRKNYLSGKVPPAIAQRFLRIYFPELKQEEDETAAFMAKLKAQEQSAVSEADIERYMSVMNQLKSLQSE